MAYQTITAILEQIDADASAAEVHGIATGMLCVNAKTTAGYWLAETLHDDNLLSDSNKQILLRLFEGTRSLLNNDEFEFDLFLPDDDTPLSDQAQALTNWCKGFLFGVGSLHPASGMSAEARDILKDMTEFTKLDTDAKGEEDESALTEIIEYIRSAVLLLREEFDDQAKHTFH